MVLTILKILILLVGLVLAAFQFLLWFVKSKRQELLSARANVMIAWVALLLILLAKILFFR